MIRLGSLSLDWSPLLPWPVLGALAVLALLVVGLGLWRRARGITLRALALALLLLTLANPSLLQEERRYLDDVAVLLVDDSPSQQIERRPAQTEQAVAEIARRVKALGGVDLRIVHAGGAAPGEPAPDETRLFGPLAAALADLPSRRLAGLVVVSDGQIHDAPADARGLGFDAPLHLLLTGEADEGDRRLTVTQAPTFALVGKSVTMTLRVEDLPATGAGGTAEVTILRDGVPLPPRQVPLGTDQQIELPIEHGGPTVFEIEAAKGPRELTLLNNRAVIVVNGVRDRLRVLLISGEPHPGERTWRNLLKSDPAVDLVHFTILRPPEKQDGTPINELSLIAFPVRELFELKLDQFDLVIFDRYRRRGVLPPAYFDNIAHYVENGGALLESAATTDDEPLALGESPLARILPGHLTGEVLERGFKPVVSEVGRRHPVTADLPGSGPNGPSWGRWFREADVQVDHGVTVMTGIDGRPLLVLDRFGKGRVAQLLSDQIWLWSRGFEGGGPQAELLRRIAHWLMKEPELEEEDLRAITTDGRVEITRQSLNPAPVGVEVTLPSGKVVKLALTDRGGGRATASLPASEPGLYRITDGTHRAFAASGELNPLEFSDLRANAEKLQPLITATGGTVHRLIDGGVPDIRKVRPGRDAGGHGWIGLRSNGDYVVNGVNQLPLLPALLVLLLSLGVLLLGWQREGR
jgi:hypothetical protein